MNLRGIFSRFVESLGSYGVDVSGGNPFMGLYIHSVDPVLRMPLEPKEERPAPVIGKNVYVTPKNEHDECGDMTWLGRDFPLEKKAAAGKPVVSPDHIRQYGM